MSEPSEGWTRFASLGRSKLTRVVTYVVAVTSFWTVLARNNAAVAKATGLQSSWNQILVGIGAPTLLFVIFEGLPGLRRRLYRPRPASAIINGYFQLTPMVAPPPGQEQFRADRADEMIFEWLQRRNAPSLLYLTGRSGSGKSSLLRGSVLPRLRSATPPVVLAEIRNYGPAGVAALRDQIVRPGAIWKAPRDDLPESLPDLIERVGEYWKGSKERTRLMLVCDQFEGLLIQQARKKDDADPILMLLRWLYETSPEYVQALMVLRDGDGDRFIEDLPDLGLAPVSQDENWKIVGPFRRDAAKAFLGRSGLELSDKSLNAIVTHASELDESPDGKVRPVVLNLIGLALEADTKRAESIRSRDAARRLLWGFVKSILDDPAVRDHAPEILSMMVEPEGRKRSPAATIAELSKECHLSTNRIYGCLLRLSTPHGIVRRTAGGPEDPKEAQIYEVAHDFVARILASILPMLKASVWSRFRPWLGPSALALCTIAVFGASQRETSRQLMLSRREIALTTWVGRFSGRQERYENGKYYVEFSISNPNQPYPKAILASVDDDIADLIQSLRIRGPFAVFSEDPISGEHRNELAGYGTLPPEISKLKSLTTLALGDTRLARLPPEISKLKALTTLDLEDTRLRTLPPVICELKGLKTLHLSYNLELRALPAEIGQIKSLTTLCLSRTGLSTLPPEIGDLKNLTTLDLSFNSQLTTLPPEIGRLKNLSTLNLTLTRLTTLPPEIGDLKNLTTLDLFTTGLTTLPPEIGKLTNLKNLYLPPNLTNPPPEVARKGTGAVLDYLRKQAITTGN